MQSIRPIAVATAALTLACLMLGAAQETPKAPSRQRSGTSAGNGSGSASSSAPKSTAKAPAGAPAAAPASTGAASGSEGSDRPGLEETRLTLAKWIETQQIIAKERNDWQQGKEILEGRIELVGKEVSVLKEKIAESVKAVAESDQKKERLVAENEQLKATAAQLSTAVSVMEGQVRGLAKRMPQPVAERLAPLLQRIPTEASTTRVTVAERFQNVLGILNEMNRANSEISLSYEVRTLADGSSSEVQVIYVGLAQAYYLSPRGEAGIGTPGEDGWNWKPAPEIAGQLLVALEVIQGKHPPAFVPLPVEIK
jgi:FtsZ-binding cell division protein ZapB